MTLCSSSKYNILNKNKQITILFMTLRIAKFGKCQYKYNT